MQLISFFLSALFSTLARRTLLAMSFPAIISGQLLSERSGAVGKIFGCWSLSSVGLWHSGHPLTVQNGFVRQHSGPELAVF